MEQSNENYYFVPMGREKGGYLDMLGLPPNATEVQAGQKEAQYLKEAKKEFKARRKAADEKLKAGEITREQFDAQVLEYEKEKDEKLKKLNKLKESFKAAQAQRRKLASEGVQDDAAVWEDGYALGDPREALALLSRPRALPKIGAAFLAKIRERWLGARGIARSAAHETFDPPAVRTIATERDLIPLLQADSLWGRLGYTNRSLWQKRVGEWQAEIAQAVPRWQDRAKNKPAPDFPEMCRPFPLAIESLGLNQAVFLFRMGADLEEGLDKTLIGPKLREQFQDHDVNLSDNLVVKAVKKGRSWSVRDEVSQRQFAVKKEDGGLGVYEESTEVVQKPQREKRLELGAFLATMEGETAGEIHDRESLKKQKLDEFIAALASLQQSGDLAEEEIVRKMKEKGWKVEAMKLLWAELEKKREDAEAMCREAQDLEQKGKPEEAIKKYGEYERLCRALDNKKGVARALNFKGIYLKGRREFDAALKAHEEQESLCKKMNYFEGLVEALGNQAAVLASQGNPTRAMALVERARRLAAEHGLNNLVLQAENMIQQIKTLLSRQRELESKSALLLTAFKVDKGVLSIKCKKCQKEFSHRPDLATLGNGLYLTCPHCNQCHCLGPELAGMAVELLKSMPDLTLEINLDKK